ncbi:cytochrome P450 71D11 [Cannabis sativa]|uniref:cytochrome P450 71D11 n=1 Tax=Cannabis sativa TaxID=3483 RepID=UPI0011DFF1D7|nr:cytochrome P450 71D11 [Cannabis sativa]XP_060972826.1 cytochrome P450 71D11 [Cannabis sativa]XP_060972827.1 cytochrome P450 71D11 [Cannabis sativa]XP_060972828.1 cytochrome P450 71D11 [Cannabis sativa]XP_060972829.1 cytochrome P450 71D11 [Cannabis sativa]XP_060972830.1 cytochrome P450 71D11 [Cannabis sativa]XP_060972831.1 cytochrome P450 71D11 [Cannabis sativa]
MFGSSLIHHTLRDLAKKYGPLMHMNIGEVPTIVISSPEFAKQVMRVHDVNFASRPSILFSKIMLYDGASLAFAPYGEHWRQVRKIFMQELLNTTRVQSFNYIREEEMLNFVDSISSNVGNVINLSERLNTLMYNIISRAACGRTRIHNKEFLSLLTEIVEVSLGFELSDLFPSFKLFYQMSRSKPKLERLRERTAKIFEEIIHEHKKQKPKERSDEDFVDVLLKYHHDNDDLGFSLTNENIYAIIFEIFGAGIETSASSVEWVMSELMKNPKIMKKAQDEVREVFRRKGLGNERALDEMKYLKSVIKESMRLHPILPLIVPRQNQKKCEINGYEIPAKTNTIINAWVIGRDSNYWPEPEIFKPERFLDDSNCIDSKLGNNFEYLPFGGGRRICVGMSFGLLSVELSLALLLYHFDWMLPNGVKNEDLDMTESFRATLQRKIFLQVIPIIQELSTSTAN